MCIVVDINCLPAVLNKKDVAHPEFKPVLDWIQGGGGKLVYGGSTYIEELGRLKRCLAAVITLANKARTVHVPDQEVDDKQNEIDKLCVNRQFNDSHLVAIIVVSRCRLLCSQDKNSFPFIKSNKFYVGNRPPVKKPKIYTKRINEGLFVDANIADICKPCKKVNKSSKSRN